MTAETWVLQADNIACRRGLRTVLSELCFTFSAGEVWWLAGNNGSGKTTMLRVLAGLLRHDGRLLWQGRSIAGDDRSEYQRQLAYVGHRSGVDGRLTVMENMAALSLDAPMQARKSALDKFGFCEKSSIPARFLSEGQRKRIALAAIATKLSRPLWLLDEPFVNLDTDAAGVLQSLIAERAAMGLITVFSSHLEIAMPVTVHKLAIGQNG